MHAMDKEANVAALGDLIKLAQAVMAKGAGDETLADKVLQVEAAETPAQEMEESPKEKALEEMADVEPTMHDQFKALMHKGKLKPQMAGMMVATEAKGKMKPKGKAKYG